MLKDISKKLTMKKSFFVTQLEGFFNAISQEYQELIHQKEVENSLLEEQVQKLQKDIDNLVTIRKELTEQLQRQQEHIKKLEEEAYRNKKLSEDDLYKKLLEENHTLRAELKKSGSEEVRQLKAQLEKLQRFIARGGDSYRENLDMQNREALIEEINKSLKR